MVEMAGFRNGLAHEWAEIDEQRVYASLQDGDDFRSFATEIAEVIDEGESDSCSCLQA